MNLFKTFENIIKTNLSEYKLKWCFVGEKKIPFNIFGQIVKSNNSQDFVDFTKLIENYNAQYLGVGISVNFSNVIALDVDKCLKIPFDITSIDERGKDILELFKGHYVEMSFSGTGLRALMFSDFKADFTTEFYIKNSKQNIEIYFPHLAPRYVTITGLYLYQPKILTASETLLKTFLNKYMLRREIVQPTVKTQTLTLDESKKKLVVFFHKDSRFLEKWVSKAPGSGRNESETDFYILKLLYLNISDDITVIKELFETSDYFKSKDKKHLHKWHNTNYFNDTIKKIKGGF